MPRPSRRMASRLFALAAGVSLVLCAATVVLWVRSYWVSDTWARDAPGTRTGVVSGRGWVAWRRVTYTPGAPVMFNGPAGYQKGPATAVSSNLTLASWVFAGFRGSHFRFAVSRPPAAAASVTIHEFVMPLWAPAMTTGVLPALWLLLWARRRKRKPPGCCPKCGYDLRATPERCPECGTPVTPATTKGAA